MNIRRWMVVAGLLAMLGGGALHAPPASAQAAPPGERWKAQVTIIAGTLGISEDALQTQLVTNHQSVAQLAAARNIDLNTIVDALVVEPAAGLATAVAAGRITQADADAKLANLRAMTTQQLTRPGWPVPPRHSPYAGPGYPEAPLPEQLAIIAAQLGMTADALQQELVTNHQSVAQLAKAGNVDLNTIVDALTAEVAGDLADEVRNGRMTQEQADDRLQDLRGDTLTHLGWPGWPVPPADGGNNHWREQVTIIAEKLGISEDALQTELVRNHQTVVQLAAAYRVDLTAIVDALVAEPAAGLATEVEDGRISQADADARLKNLRDLTAQQLNRPGWPVPPDERPGHA
jgi:prolyl-tRNA editing enzyme YbaK/EbsC (Cys-tRNA(Pro) deacylase)